MEEPAVRQDGGKTRGTEYRGRECGGNDSQAFAMDRLPPPNTLRVS